MSNTTSTPSRQSPALAGRLAIAALLSLSPTPTFAALELDHVFRSFPVGSYPQAIAVARLDGDERLDIVTVNTSGPSLTLWRGGTSDLLVDRSEMPLRSGPTGLAVADFTHDGSLDLAVGYVRAFARDTVVSIYAGDGDGGFVHVGDYNGGPGPRFLAAGDFDEDGHQDLVIAALEDQLRLLKGDGAGGFSATTILPVMFRVAAPIRITDANGDSHLDILVLHHHPIMPSRIALLLGDGDGGFVQHDHDVGIGGIDAEVAEVTGDGVPDLLVAVAPLTNDDGIEIHAGDGLGGFSHLRTYAVKGDPNGLECDDLDGDGWHDLLFLTFEEVNVAFGTGSAEFGPPTTYGTGTGPSRVIAADIDGNQRLDILTLNRSGNAIGVYRNDGQRGFGLGRSVAATGSEVGTGDLNADDRSDVLTSHNSSRLLELRTAVGAGELSAPQFISTAPKPYVVELLAADLDGDGNDEAVALHSGRCEGCLGTLVGFGGQSGLAFLDSVATGRLSTAAASGQLDEDDRSDIAVSNLGSDSVTIVHGDTSGFGYRESIATGSESYDVAIGDVDGDGKNEIVTAHPEGLSIHRRHGSTYSHELYPLWGWPVAIAIGNIDEDPLCEIVVASEYGGLIIVDTDVDGQLALPRRVSFDDGAVQIAIADLDDDGVGEVLALLWGAQAVAVFSGYRNEGFESRRDFGVGYRPRDMSTGDIDGDGRIDVVVTRPWNESLVVLLNRSDTTTPAQISLADARATEAGVSLWWRLSGVGALRFRVERSADGAAWIPLEILMADGNGDLRFLDPSISPGNRYAYRIRQQDGALVSEVTWVTVPDRRSTSFWIRNPTGHRVRFGGQIPGRGIMTIEWWDLQGRRVASMPVPATSSEPQELELPRSLRSGLYFVVLRRGTEQRTVRVTVISER